MLTESDVLGGLRDLAVVFRPPNGRDEIDRLVRVYRKALDDVNPFEFRAAVEEYLANGQRFWPTPSKIRTLVDERRHKNPRATSTLPLRAQYGRWQSSGDVVNEPCPVCGAKLEPDSATQTHRPHVYHDHQIHYEAGVGYAGPRTGPVDARNHMLSDGPTSVTKLLAGDTA
ncbi:MAG: hypothetical protein IIB90_18810 [Gemmatimonadetes bacterium]|nr:hypothetical protein [Gemmatimonadota bacterium]